MGRNEKGSGAIQLFHRGPPDSQTVLVCVRHIIRVLCGHGHLHSGHRRDAGMADSGYILGGHLSTCARCGFTLAFPCM